MDGRWRDRTASKSWGLIGALKKDAPEDVPEVCNIWPGMTLCLCSRIPPDLSTQIPVQIVGKEFQRILGKMNRIQDLGKLLLQLQHRLG
jgi:hypothetical protein